MILTNIITNPRERKRFVRFAIVGTIGAFVDFGTFNLLSGIIRIKPVWASVISFLAAISSNFLWNRYWTYPDSRSKPIRRQIAEFAIVNLIGLGIRTPLFSVLSASLEKYFNSESYLPYAFITPEFLSHNVSLAIAVIVVMFWNFYINRYWTYGDVK